MHAGLSLDSTSIQPPDSVKRPAVHKKSRRAPRACLHCRARKVRCDVIEGLPCRNCHWDGVQCTVQDRRRGVIPRRTTDNAPSASTKVVETRQCLSPTRTCSSTPRTNVEANEVNEVNEVNAIYASMLTPSITSVASTDREERWPSISSTSSADDVLCDSSMSDVSQRDHSRSTSNPQPHSQSRFLLSMIQLLRAPTWASPESSTSSSARYLSEIRADLPRCFKPPSSDLDSKTLKFLHSSGALRLPHPALQRSLLEAYLQGVHPSKPCVDMHELARCLEPSLAPKNSISLMLYQAIMFAGSVFIRKDILESQGYKTRAAAMEDMFRRAKLLYSLDYDKEPISTIQTLLLFSLRASPSSKHQGPSHWIQLAIHLARKEGLNHHAAEELQSPGTISSRRRLWWCCVVQDNLAALAACHRPSISLEETQTCTLQVADFDLATLYGVQGFEGSGKLLDELMPLAEVFIETAKLSAILNRVLWSKYEPGLARMDSSRSIELSKALEQWQQELPSSCQAPDPALMLHNKDASSLDVQRTILLMTYHTTTSLLLRQMPSSDMFTTESAATAMQTFTVNETECVQSIMRLAAILVTCELEEVVPISGIILLLPALLSHTLHASGHTIDYRTAQDAQQSLQLLERMKEKFDFADVAACHLEILRAGTTSVSIAEEDVAVLEQDEGHPRAPFGDPEGHVMSPVEAALSSTSVPDLDISLHDLESAEFAAFGVLNDASPRSLDYDSSGLAFLADTPNLT